MNQNPGGGLSRKAIIEQVDASLARLGTNYVDLMQIHRFDPEVPVEETMEALHDVVKAGKVRYLGASSMWAWQYAKLQATAELHGWTTFVSMQDQYNLVQREEKREMQGLLADEGVGSLTWSPLGGGIVARPWGGGIRAPPGRSPIRPSTSSVGSCSSTRTRPSSMPSRRLPMTVACPWLPSLWRGC